MAIDLLADDNSNDLLKEEEPSSLAHSYAEYLKGYSNQLFESGAKGGYHLGMTPSYLWEAITGHPLYSLVKPEETGYIPESNAAKVGQYAGEKVASLSSLLAGGTLASTISRALTRYHPLTKGQVGRQIRRPINAAEGANVRFPLSYRQLHELDQLLSHPGLERGGSTGRALTPMGRNSVLEGASEGRPNTLFSAQSLLGDLERAIPSRGESILASTRVRPLKIEILEGLQNAMREASLEREANELQLAREGARRHYQTRKAIHKVMKPLSIAALIRSAVRGMK